MCCEMRWWLKRRSGLPVPASQPHMPQAVMKKCSSTLESGVRSVIGSLNGCDGARADHVHDLFDVGAWAKCEKVVNIGGEGHSELGVPEEARLICALLETDRD